MKTKFTKAAPAFTNDELARVKASLAEAERVLAQSKAIQERTLREMKQNEPDDNTLAYTGVNLLLGYFKHSKERSCYTECTSPGGKGHHYYGFSYFG